MTHSVSKRKQEMAAALQTTAGEVWAMEPRAFEAMVSQMAAMAATGDKPEAEIPQRQPMMMAETEGGLIAVIPITGVIRPNMDAITRRMGGTALSAVVAEYLQALSNSQVSQIVFYFDTPGGSVSGLSEFSALIEANAKKKPTSAVIGSMCASAGYWIASGIPNVRANADSLIGSIGVIVMDVSVARIYKEIGFDVDVITYGERKADGNPFAPMTDGRHNAFQEQVNEYGALFVNHVAKSRKVSVETVRAEFGDGKVFPGRNALKRGMIDAVVPMFLMSSQSNQNGTQSNRNANQIPSVSELAAAATVQLPAVCMATNPTNFDLGHVVASAVTVPTLAATVGSAASGPISQAAIKPAIQEKPMAISARVKSALYATGFTQQNDAPDAVCEAALSAFYLARGAEQPAEEKQILGDLASVLSKPATTTATAVAPPTKPAVSAEDYRDRLANVQSIADLANMAQPGAITQAMVMEAVNADNFAKPIEAIQREWKEKISASQPQIAITIKGTGAEALHTDAVNAIAYKITGGRKGKANALVDAHPMKLVTLSLGAAAAGIESPEVLAKKALGLSADGQSIMASGNGGVGRAGDFPNMMNSVSDLIMDDAAATAEMSFPIIAERFPDADTMDITSIGGFGVIDSLDVHIDGNDASEKKLTEESKGFIQLVHYANDIALTWMMLTDAVKFNNFLYALRELRMAGPRQLNRTIISLIAQNTVLIDGVALFHADHSNLVASGNGAPSDTTLADNRALHATQRAPGATTKSGTDPRIVLVPDALKVTATKAFRTIMTMVGSQAVANLESSQSYFKDSVRVVSDPELDNFSTAYWYSLVDPSQRGLRSLVYRYKSGYGPNGMTSDYADPAKRGRVYSIDFVAGAAVAGHRGIVRNNG
jgi:capsid assembly protease